MKDRVRRMKRWATDWKKIFVKHTSDKALLPKMHESSNATVRKQTDLKLGQRPEHTPHQRQARDKCSASYVLREMQNLGAARTSLSR